MLKIYFVKILSVSAMIILLLSGWSGGVAGKIEPALPAVTNPTIEWNTFMGGSSNDFSKGIALDGNGNSYAVGYSYTTWGSPARTYQGGSDAFVAKLNSSGARQWNTFLGSTANDEGHSIVIDGSGNSYVVGTSEATWESPVSGFQGASDAFVAKLNNSGTLQWHTFVGGSASDVGNGIAVDLNGNIYIVGVSTAGWGSPVDPYPIGEWQCPFAAKLNSSGALQWNTFWGSGGLDNGSGITVDESGNVYLAGQCYNSWGSPVNPYAGSTDACVAKLNTSGVRQWNTFMGSDDSESGNGIALQGNNVYVVGVSAKNWGTPVNPYNSGGSGYDAFAAKLNAGTGVREWNTFMGGPQPDNGNGIVADNAGNVYVVGDTKDTLVVGDGAPASVFTDAYLVKLKSDGARDWVVYMGATYNNDSASGVVMDTNGHVGVIGHSKETWGSPVNPYTGLLDTFVAKWEVPAESDLEIAKSVTPGYHNPDEMLKYILSYSNQGTLTATGVVITDTIPTQLTSVSYIASGATVTPVGGTKYVWNVQNLAPGASGIITVTGTIKADVPHGTRFVNTALIGGSTEESDPDDNSSSVWVLVPLQIIFLPVIIK